MDEETYEIILCDTNGIPFPDEDPLVFDKKTWFKMVKAADIAGQTLEEFVISALKHFVSDHQDKHDDHRENDKVSGDIPQ